MRAYLPAAAFSMAFLAWLFSGWGHEGASEARDAAPELDLRKGLAEGARVETTASVPAPTPPPEGAQAPRRPVRIVYPPPYEAR